jgi:hypothetical protein
MCQYKLWSKQNGAYLILWLKIGDLKSKEFAFCKGIGEQDFNIQWNKFKSEMINLRIWDSFDKKWPEFENELRNFQPILARICIVQGDNAVWEDLEMPPGIVSSTNKLSREEKRKTLPKAPSDGTGNSSLGIDLNDTGPVGVLPSTRFMSPRKENEPYMDNLGKTYQQWLDELNK